MDTKNLVLSIVAGAISGLVGAIVAVTAGLSSGSTMTVKNLVADEILVKEGILIGKEKGSAIVLALSTDGDPRIVLNDKTGQARAILGASEIRDQSIFTGVESTEKRAVSSLILMNQKGEVFWKAP